MRLIDVDALKDAFDIIASKSAISNSQTIPIVHIKQIIDNAPTVEYPFYQEAYQTGYEELINMMKLTHKRLSNELESINQRHVILVNLIAEYEHLIRCATDNDIDTVLKEIKDNA